MSRFKLRHFLSMQCQTFKRHPRIQLSPHQNILFLGEGNLSFSLNYLWHDLSRRENMVITEYPSHQQMTEVPGFNRNYNMLKTLGTDVIFGIDATYLHGTFRKHRFQHIYFANPYPVGENEMNDLIPPFFISAAEVQEIDDCIHLVLPFRSQEKKTTDWELFYGILMTEFLADYRLKEISTFKKNGICVYPLYEHSKVFNFKNKDPPLCTENMQCYTFAKLSNSNKNRLSKINPGFSTRFPLQNISVLKEPDFSFPIDGDDSVKSSLDHYMNIVQEKKRKLGTQE